MSIKLSVGIMVKNQTKELRECLERLADTRAKLETEIIIHVDDSSTEDTFAVAKEFTDKVRYFKWIDDYSAIKNGLMEEARGEWVWILDADEFACDTTPLLDFLKSDEAKKYSVLQYYERNFFDKRRKISKIQYAPRIYKASANHRYMNRVHEGVNLWGIDVKQLEMYVDHTGYIDLETSEKLKVRRLEIEREYKSNPKDLRIIISYADTLISPNNADLPALIELLENSKELAQKSPEDMCSGNVYLRLVKIYAINGDLNKAVYIAQEYEGVACQANYSLGEIYSFLAQIFYKEKKYAQSIKYFEKYLYIYTKVLDKTICKIDIDMPSYNSLMIGSDNVKENISTYATALAQLSQVESARQQLTRDELKGYDGIQAYVAWFILGQKLKDASIIVNKYLEALKGKASIENCRAAYEQALSREALQEFDLQAMKELSRLKDTLYDDIYIKFNALRTTGLFENSKEILQEIAENSEGWAVNAFAFILYRVIKDRTPLTSVVSINTVNQLCKGTELAYRLMEKDKTILKKYFEEYGQCETLQELRIQKDMMWQVVKNELSEEDIDIEFFKMYATALGLYAVNIIPIQFCEEENLSCVSQELQLGIKMQQAFLAKTEGEIFRYIKNLKDIVKIDPSLLGVVAMLLDEVKEENEKQEKAVAELEMLADNIKAMLNQFILKKDKVNAEAIFQKLQEIVPNDKDLPKIAIKINSIE